MCVVGAKQTRIQPLPLPRAGRCLLTHAVQIGFTRDTCRALSELQVPICDLASPERHTGTALPFHPAVSRTAKRPEKALMSGQPRNIREPKDLTP